MKKINSALRSFNKDLTNKYGEMKCFLYRFWDDIIFKAIDKNVAIRKIIYTSDNKTIVHVHSDNKGLLMKLHYMIPHIVQQIQHSFGKNLDIEIKISR